MQTQRRLGDPQKGKLPSVSATHPDLQTAIPAPPLSPKAPASGRSSLGPSLPKSPMSQSTSAGSRCSTPNRVPVCALREMALPQSPHRQAHRANTDFVVVGANQGGPGGAGVSNNPSPVAPLPGTGPLQGTTPQGAPPASSSSGLRARRQYMNQVSRPLQVDTSSPAEDNEGAKRRIQLVEAVDHHYEIGQTVMPSCHHDMEIRFAHQLPRSSSKDEDCCRSVKGREYVVKIRRKPGSFKTQKDESAWRASTELMLNLPPCAGIAQVAEVLEDAAGFYVVMEKVDGLDLHEWLCASGPLDLDGVKDVLRQLLQAVGKLHENGCIHKDLKLENVMLEALSHSAPESQASALSPPTSSPCSSKELVAPASPGRFSVKVVDFDTVEDWSPKSPTATRVLGTDQYIAPEAYEGRYSPASDIFAVGVIAYRLLAGTFPFRNSLFDDKPGENWVGSPKMREIKNRLNNVRLDWQRPNLMALPAQERTMAQRLISRMLAINEAQRPSAQEALLDAWLAPVEARPAPSPPAPERRRTQARSSIN